MITWEQTFIKIAELFAQRSSCVKRKVGAILAKDKRILSSGYNGTPSGFVNCNKVFESGDLKNGVLVKKHGNKIHNITLEKITHHDFAERYEIHAEQNCLAYAARNGVNTEGCDIYVTTAPCAQCAKLIIAAGIKKVYYKEIYKNSDGLNLLSDANIETIQVGE